MDEYLLYCILILHSIAIAVNGSCVVALDKKIEDTTNDRV